VNCPPICRTKAALEPPPRRKYPIWDEKFEGVVHDANNIARSVAEYRWQSNYFLCRVEWEGRVYGSAEAAYQSGKYSLTDRDVFTTLDPDAAKPTSRTDVV
jgi:hypothetical protein